MILLKNWSKEITNRYIVLTFNHGLLSFDIKFLAIAKIATWRLTMLISQFISISNKSCKSLLKYPIPQDLPKSLELSMELFDQFKCVYDDDTLNKNQNFALLFWSPRNFYKNTKNTQSLVQYWRGDSLCLGSTYTYVFYFIPNLHSIQIHTEESFMICRLAWSGQIKKINDDLCAPQC